MAKKVLIIGGVAGGASAAPRLRRLDESAEIIMFERGEYVSYANCGLPYYVGGIIQDKDALTVQKPEDFRDKFNIDVRISEEVIAIDREEKKVRVKRVKTDEEYEESYDSLILSMGAEPLKPPIPGSDSSRVFTLRSIPDTFRIKEYIETQKPKSAIVMGGGFIGVEMAENLRHAGLSVTLVEMLDQVLAPIDADMAADVHRNLERNGVALELGNGVKSMEDTGSELEVTLTEGKISADMLIMAIGVRPETKIAKEAGIELNERGAIVTDAHMRTSDPSIYAVGDAIEITDPVTGTKGYVALAGPANKQGRIAADNIYGLDTTYVGTQGTSVLQVFDMTVASTGVNEKTAKRLGLSYDKSFIYVGNHANYYPGVVNMSIKTLFDPKDGRILGAQIIGYDGVDKRIDVIATAIRAKMTARDLADLELAYAPPFGSAKDPINMIGFVIENLVTGKVKQVHWHDLDAIKEEGKAQLVDVRSAVEFENGAIDGFTLIPQTELRDRLGELDPKRPIILSCQMGLKAYASARMLEANGFDASILAGGYRLYHSIFGKRPKPAQTAAPTQPFTPQADVVTVVDACGMQCPGPIVKLSEAMGSIQPGGIVEISTSDPAFESDVEGYCRRTGNTFLGIERAKGITKARIQKGEPSLAPATVTGGDNKNMIIFSGDLDKAIASFIIANAAAAMGRKVSMFFTFWGLNILRKPEPVSVTKDFMSKMFGFMMPRGAGKLGLSKMNMGGMGAKMIRAVMKNKNIDSLEDLIAQAQKNGVELLACSMSMDVMGIQEEELIDGVKLAGAAAMLANAEESDMSLFI